MTVPKHALSGLTIDIIPNQENPESETARRLIDNVQAACKSTGVVQKHAQAIPKHFQQNIIDAAKQFFSFSFYETKNLDARKDAGNRGSNVLASSSSETNVLSDLKVRVFGYKCALPLNII
jgi:isopenicillin N synthase-like dioxygenase